ncbi:MAG: DUF6075 family protein [Lachnospiraceae bacterium]|nr:DUF6075 family protein [Lachnospiraceae bacterium]
MNTALRAKSDCEHLGKNTRKVTFKNQSHHEFYDEYMKECRYDDVYHKALIYCLGINEDTRNRIYEIYDFKSGCVNTECLKQGWITSGSEKVIRMAFNLYCNSAPSVDDYKRHEDQLTELRQYTVEDLFCSGYARYFWEAVKIRYPEYCFYVDWEDLYDKDQIARNERGH